MGSFLLSVVISSQAMASGEAREKRRAHVQALRRAARSCGVTPVRDDASKSKVEAMMALIRQATGQDDAKKEAEKEFKLFWGT